MIEGANVDNLCLCCREKGKESEESERTQKERRRRERWEEKKSSPDREDKVGSTKTIEIPVDDTAAA